MSNGRRNLLRAGSLCGISAFLGSCVPWSIAWWQAGETAEVRARRAMDAFLRAFESMQQDDQLSESERLARDREWLRLAEEAEASEVERLYSTRPVRFTFAGHKYAVPANYFAPKDDRYEGLNTESKGFGFYLFLPDYGGYTKSNWQDPFDRRKITVTGIEQVEKIAMGTFTDGSRQPLSPDRFDPRVTFERSKSRLEDKSVQLYGLTVYRNRGGDNSPGAVWTGTRSNGEFFWFRSSLAPRQPKQDGYPPNPQCDVRYYSEKEDLAIVYRYSQDHVAKWREIDDAIWSKIRGWRVS